MIKGGKVMIFELLMKVFGKKDELMGTLADCKNWIDNHAEVTFAASMAVSAVGTVVACKETAELIEKKPEFEAKLEVARAESEALKAAGQPYHKPLARAYGKMALDVIHGYRWAIALKVLGVGGAAKSFGTVVSQRNKITAAYIGLKESHDKLLKKLENDEKFKKEQAEEAKKKVIESDKQLEGDINGTVIEFNGTCKQFFEDNPRANMLVVTSIMATLEDRFMKRNHIYPNDLITLMSKKPLKHGYDYVRVRRGANDKLDFGLDNYDLNAGFIDGVDPVCRFLLKDFVPVSVMYDEKYKDAPFYIGNDGTVDVEGGTVFDNDAFGKKPCVVI